jgi:hypothetical protein
VEVRESKGDRNYNKIQVAVRALSGALRYYPRETQSPHAERRREEGECICR